MFWFVLTTALILIDQVSKFAATQLGWPIFLNDQFAFSLPLHPAIMFTIYIVVLAGMSFYIYRAHLRFSKLQKYAWCFVYAGGLSNIIERLLTGHVKDFIPVANGMLNLADFYILIGLILILVDSRYQRADNE